MIAMSLSKDGEDLGSGQIGGCEQVGSVIQALVEAGFTVTLSPDPSIVTADSRMRLQRTLDEYLGVTR